MLFPVDLVHSESHSLILFTSYWISILPVVPQDQLFRYNAYVWRTGHLWIFISLTPHSTSRPILLKGSDISAESVVDISKLYALLYVSWIFFELHYTILTSKDWVIGVALS